MRKRILTMAMAAVMAVAPVAESGAITVLAAEEDSEEEYAAEEESSDESESAPEEESTAQPEETTEVPVIQEQTEETAA